RVQVFVLGASFLGTVEGQFFQLVVADRNAEGVPEFAQALGIHLLGVVGDVLALAGPGAVALDGLGQDDAGLTLVGGRGVVGSVHLVGIVAAAVELPDFLVGHVLDHLLQFRAGAEEVFADIGPVVGLVVLVVAVNGLFHALLQQAVVVAGQQRIPQAAPDDLDHVPVGAAEVAFQLLDDLAVTPYRAIQTLQVAADDENQVVQLRSAGQGDGTQAFGLVAFTVTQDAPDLLLARLDVAAALQVLQEARLVDRLNRPQTHGYGGELPEVRHQPGVRIGGPAVAARK